MKIVLAFAADIDIHSLPGDERDRVYKLQRHCINVDSLLLKPSVNAQAVRAGCREAKSQLFYLLELQSIAWATAVEALCPIREEECWATIPMMYSKL